MKDKNQVSLFDYVESRFKATEKATKLAYALLEKRLEGMNEFRAALRDQANQFMYRNEHGVVHEHLDADIRILRESKALLEGKASQESVDKLRNYATLAMIITIVGVCVSIGALITAIILQ